MCVGYFPNENRGVGGSFPTHALADKLDPLGLTSIPVLMSSMLTSPGPILVLSSRLVHPAGCTVIQKVEASENNQDYLNSSPQCHLLLQNSLSASYLLTGIIIISIFDVLGRLNQLIYIKCLKHTCSIVNKIIPYLMSLIGSGTLSEMTYNKTNVTIA